MEYTVSHYLNYLQIYHKDENEYSKKPLFYTKRKNIIQAMSDDNIRKFLNQYADSARKICPEVSEKIHPYLFRHSRAMHLYQHGMDLTLISQWLGHSNLETTLIYAHADTDQKRRAIEKSMGKNIIGEIANPISISLRLFANVLSGVLIMGLWYGMMPIFLKIGVPSFLHLYTDVFSGALQTYVFCMLSMVYINDKLE